MPKAIIEYNLPEENEEFMLAQNATSYYCVLTDMDNYLRSKTKYGTLTDKEQEIYEEIREKLWELAKDRKVDIW